LPIWEKDFTIGVGEGEAVEEELYYIIVLGGGGTVEGYES